MSLTQINKLRELNIGGGKPTITILDVKDVISIPQPDLDGIIRTPIKLRKDSIPVTYTFLRESPHFAIKPYVNNGADFSVTEFKAIIPKDRNSIKIEREKYFNKRAIIIYPDNNGNHRIIGSKESPVKVNFVTDHKEKYQQMNESVFSFSHYSRKEPAYIEFSYDNSSEASTEFLPESELYFAAMETAGDPLSADEKIHFNALVAARIANGTWYDRIAIYPLKGRTTEGMKINAREPGEHDLNMVGDWIATFWGLVNNDGLSTSILKTGIIPADDLPANNLSYSYYLDGNGVYPYVCGAYESATKSLISEIGATHDFSAYSSTDKISVAKTSDYGHYEVSRITGESLKAHKDGAFATEFTTLSTSSAPDREFYIGGYNNDNTVDGTWTKGAGLRWFEIGGAKTQDQMVDDRTALKVWLKAEGRYLHTAAYAAFAAETNDDFLEMQARSELFTTLEDNSMLSSMVRLQVQYTLSPTTALKDSINPANVLVNINTTPFTYYGFKGNATDKSLETGVNMASSITEISNFAVGIYSRTNTNVGCDIGSNDGTNYFEMWLRHAGNLIFKIGTATATVANDDSRGHFIMHCKDGSMVAYKNGVAVASTPITGDLPVDEPSILCTNDDGTLSDFTTREICLNWICNKELSNAEILIIDAAMGDYIEMVGKNYDVDSRLYDVISDLSLTQSLYITPIDYSARRLMVEKIAAYNNLELAYNFMTRKGVNTISLQNMASTYGLFFATDNGNTFSQKGEKGNGSSFIINTNFNPATDMAIATPDNCSVSIFLNEKYVGPEGYFFGAESSGTFLSMEYVSTPSPHIRICVNDVASFKVDLTFSGLITIQRINFKLLEVLQNGIHLAYVNAVVVGAPSNNIIINGHNNGTPANFTNPLVAGFILGTAFEDPQYFSQMASTFNQSNLRLRGF